MAKNEESLSEKIKLMTGEQMDILNNDFFNQEIESLKRRIEQVECTKTHEETAKASLSEMEERKLKVIDTTEENHKPSKEFEAIASLSAGTHILPRIPLCPEFAEEFEDPPRNPETKRGSRAKSKGDCTVKDPYRN